MVSFGGEYGNIPDIGGHLEEYWADMDLHDRWDEDHPWFDEPVGSGVISPVDGSTTGGASDTVGPPVQGTGGSEYDDYRTGLMAAEGQRMARRAAGFRGRGQGPIQLLGAPYEPALRPEPPPPPPPPDVEDYIPSDPVLNPNDPRYEDYSPDFSDDHNMPGMRRRSRSRNQSRSGELLG